MVVTIFGATTIVGKQLMVHALTKGWKVKVFGRNIESLLDKELNTKNLTAIKGYVFDETDVSNALKESSAVLSALGGESNGNDKTISLGTKNIAAQMKKNGIRRIVALGGIGVLPDNGGDYLMDSNEFPAALKSISEQQKQAYLSLKESSLDWTFVCVPNIIPKDADNHFGVESEAPANGIEISAGNLALFMVEEVVRNEYIRQRVGISNR